MNPRIASAIAPHGKSRLGFTILELLVAISLIGILAAIGASRFATPSARLFANDVRALVLQARYEAIKRNLPVAVMWAEEAQEFQTVLSSSSDPCVADEILNRTRIADYPRLDIEVTFENGDGRLVWLPSGQARSCVFGPFEEKIAEISDGRVVRVLEVTFTGRVTIE